MQCLLRCSGRMTAKVKIEALGRVAEIGKIVRAQAGLRIEKDVFVTKLFAADLGNAVEQLLIVDQCRIAVLIIYDTARAAAI